MREIFVFLLMLTDLLIVLFFDFFVYVFYLLGFGEKLLVGNGLGF